MISLLFLWFVCWCLVRLLKSEAAVTVVLVLGLIIGFILMFGFPHALRG